MKTFLSLGTQDLIKGIVMAAIAAILTGLYTSIESGHLPSTMAELKPIAISAIGAAITYLMKNFFSNSDGKFLKPEQK